MIETNSRNFHFVVHIQSLMEQGLSKHYYLRFDPKLGHGICVIIRIPRACVACKSMPDQTWIYGITSNKKSRYQPITDCTY